MPSITKAVILAAGLGTRLLPATKAIPKEMLPIADKPLLQYAVEEAVAAGIDHVVFVTAPGREAVREHFCEGGRTESMARDQGKSDVVAKVLAPARLAHFDFALQERPIGIANAVAQARRFVEGAPFALIFPDDLILGDRPVAGQLIEAYDRAGGGTVIAVQEVAEDEVPQYGIVDPAGPGNPMRLRGLVEKPPIERAPSRYGIVGRYILGASIFEHIDRTPPGANGEYQITDAIASQLAAGEGVFACEYEGQRYDTGRPVGMIVAAVAAALRREDLAPQLRARLAEILA